VRIVSLVPGATEVVAALGLGDALVGRTHECDFPAWVSEVPRVTGARLALDGLDQAAIDRAVAEAGPGGLSAVDRVALAEARPDLVITQDLCEVCGLAASDVEAAVDALPGRPVVLSLAPQTLDGVMASVEVIGAAAGVAAEGRVLASRLRERLAHVRGAVAGLPVREVVALEWLDPPYRAGHWLPDQVTAAGGRDLLGRAGAPACRVDPEEVAAADPEALLLVPCGLGAERAAAEAAGIVEACRGTRAVRNRWVVALDANACFSRPGPRLVDGVEILAAVLHPEAGLAPPPRGAAVTVRI
jgi:iron complex transport system substrate-binding protein